jgi:hypothetical protein
MSNKAKDQKSRERRKRVVTRLETQLKSGKKPMKAGEGLTVNEFVEFRGEVPLTSKDETRIKKELAVLAGRI